MCFGTQNTYPPFRGQVLSAGDTEIGDLGPVLTSLKTNLARAFTQRQEIAFNLNQATVALHSGNFELAATHANHVLHNKMAHKNSKLAAIFLLIQTRSRQGHFSGVLDELELLFKKVPRSNAELQAQVGNEILRVCHRSGNLGIGAQRGEELVREFSSSWPEIEVVELLCQLSSCHFHRGDSARAEEVVSRALEITNRSKFAKARTQTLWQSSALTTNRGDLPLALQQAREAKHWAQIAGMQHVIPILSNNAALIMLDLPDADLSRIHKLAESAYLEMSSQNNPGGSAYACEVLSEVALRQEDYENALMYAEKGLEELPSEIPGPRASLLVQVAKTRTRMGDYAVAKSELFIATEHMEQLEPSRELAKQWGDIARVFVEVGLADRGIYAYEKAIQMSGLLREEQDTKVS